MSIKTVIIDDHPHAIALLSDELKAVCVDIDVVGTANSPKEGYQLIKNSNPHLVFLDIDMPEMDGFSLLAHFPNPSFKVIFVTAFDNFAIKAFKADALDYLLKPVDRDELVRAINKYRKLTIIEQSPSTDHNLSEVCRLAVPFNGSIVFLDMLDVLYCKAEGSYSKIFTNEKSYIISRNLKETEQFLSSQFVRIHNSYSVNLQHITKYTRGEGGSVTLTNGTNLPVAKNRKDDLLKRLSVK